MPPKQTGFDPKPSTTPGSRSRSYLGLLLAISAAVILIDRLTKLFIIHHVPSDAARTIIPGVLRITHVLNTGAAFSMFAESASPATVRIALILGGAFGNLYDRVRYHYVIDFLEVRIIHYHWPDFNVADSCIVIGACLLLIEIFRPQPAN